MKFRPNRRENQYIVALLENWAALDNLARGHKVQSKFHIMLSARGDPVWAFAMRAFALVRLKKLRIITDVTGC